MNKRFRQYLIVAFTFIGGFYFFLEFILPKNISGFQFGLFHDEISRGIQVTGIMAIGLGIINILRVHGSRLLKNSSGWPNSLALLLGLFTMLTVEGVNLYQNELRLRPRAVIDNITSFVNVVEEDWKTKKAAPIPRIKAMLAELLNLKNQAQADVGYLKAVKGNRTSKKMNEEFIKKIEIAIKNTSTLATLYGNATKESEKEISEISKATITTLKQTALIASELSSYNYKQTISKQISHFFFHGFFVPLGAAMFSLLAFYIATAAYRSFRIRSLEALVMMVPAIIVMLGQIPHGPMYVSKYLPDIRRWLLEYLNTPAFRAIFFGSAIAGLAMAVRMWLSLENSPLSAEDSDGDA